MKIIKRREMVKCEQYFYCFDYKGNPNSGYQFPCDKDGNIDMAKLAPCAQQNYAKLISGEMPDYAKPYVKTLEWSYVEPTVGICNECGEEVELRNFTNTCDCGADYNMSGQQLAPRECWGEETGESWVDVINADSDSFREDW